MTVRPMSAAAVRLWRARQELSERDAAALLGISRTTLRTYEREGAPLLVALACAALAAELAPLTTGRQVRAAVAVPVVEDGHADGA